MSNTQSIGASAPAIFNFNSKKVRTIDQDGQIWFVASDICYAIGHKNPTVALSRLDEDEKQLISSSRTPKKSLGVGEQLNIINESGLYKLILRSNKKEAKIFTKWVTSEVLPTIRKTGTYNSIQLHHNTTHPKYRPNCNYQLLGKYGNAKQQIDKLKCALGEMVKAYDDEIKRLDELCNLQRFKIDTIENHE